MSLQFLEATKLFLTDWFLVVNQLTDFPLWWIFLRELFVRNDSKFFYFFGVLTFLFRLCLASVPPWVPLQVYHPRTLLLTGCHIPFLLAASLFWRNVSWCGCTVFVGMFRRTVSWPNIWRCSFWLFEDFCMVGEPSWSLKAFYSIFWSLLSNQPQYCVQRAGSHSDAKISF